MSFRSSRYFVHRKHDSRHAKFCNFHLKKSLLGPWLQYIIALNSFTLALKTSFQALKRRSDRFKTEIFSWWFEHVFTLKSLLERLKRNFDGSKIVSFQSTNKL